MKDWKILFILVFAVIGFQACSDDDDPTPDPSPSLEAPGTYNFERNGQSTVSFSGQTTRIKMASELINAMKKFDSSSELLLEMYVNESASGGDVAPFSESDLNSSTKSIRSKVAASKDFFSANAAESSQIKADFESWINAQVSEVFPNENVLAEPGVAGQIADGSSVRYVNAKGLEYNQAVNKGLIGALMVDQMVNNYLSPAVLDDGNNVAENDDGILAEDKSYTTMEHKWDEAYGYLFGTSTNAANPLPTLGEDAFLNKYLQRVNGDPDFEGIAQDIFDAFKLGRAAIVAGDYQLRDEQAEIVRGLVSKVIGVRAVYYLQQGKNGLPDSGNDYGGAFHDLSEGFGFVYSLRFTRQPESSSSYFSKAEVDGFIQQLTEGNGFWDVTPATLDQISEAIASKFDFSLSQAAE